MRDPALNPLFAGVSSLKGVGPKAAILLQKLLGTEFEPRVIDLLLHLPSAIIDRRARPTLAEAEPGQIVTLDVWIDRHRPAPPQNRRAPYRVFASDATGDIQLVWFNAFRSRIEQLCPVGEKRVISGTIELFDGMRQMVHPHHVLSEDEALTMPLIEPVYPLTEGLAAGLVRRAQQEALGKLPALAEWLDRHGQKRMGWPSFAEALAHLHQPQSPAQATPEGLDWTRLAYDELLAGQLALAFVRDTLRRPLGRHTRGDGQRQQAIIHALPFTLTGAQSRAIADITADMASDKRMMRLLQGDVGAGKTVVALVAMAAAAEAGRQSALMAPTEILARQHAATLTKLAAPAGLTVAVLTGREKGKERERILAGLADGSLHIIVGTHALFQDSVAFHDLGLAVIDEQHRFGVHQRLALTNKGEAVDLLVMTATPIPRTLVLTYFGDMDASALNEKPKGRQPIDTRVLPMERLGDVASRLGAALAEGAQIYWVCPLVSESEETDLAAAEARFDDLRRIYGAEVGLLHGQMKGSEKDAAMAAFQHGQTRILVATTVIEVGVDVPAATIMVIEHAERFGLAQLHQLRGRVGRGEGKSSCILLYREPLSQMGTERLKVIRDSEDGFFIAEQDLRLRGEGDVLGTKQSGLPGFQVARLPVHAPLIEEARADARALLQSDPKLTSERGQALRNLLHLFGKADVIRLIQAG